MSTEDPLELVPCPFDPVHMVQRKRMQYHIMKCSKVCDGQSVSLCVTWHTSFVRTWTWGSLGPVHSTPSTLWLSKNMSITWRHVKEGYDLWCPYLYAYVCLCMLMYGICMLMYAYVCLCMGYVCLCMLMYAYVCLCMLMYAYVCLCMLMYGIWYCTHCAHTVW